MANFTLDLFGFIIGPYIRAILDDRISAQKDTVAQYTGLTF